MRVTCGDGGSSPLTRGKLHVRVVPVNGGRLIPAHAGKTPPRKPPWTSTWAHPRSRGENLSSRPWRDGGRGSSPLTRGKRPARQPGHAVRGLIPAHAGKTVLGTPTKPSDRAHPRSRGENRRWGASPWPPGGSSPLTRGKRLIARPTGPQAGLIPAHAGKTPSPSSPCSSRMAHPRSRGENEIPRTTRVIADGSSPLTRGKRRHPFEQWLLRRLIPAHAGKTSRRGRRKPERGAHPRSRGENMSPSSRVTS